MKKAQSVYKLVGVDLADNNRIKPLTFFWWRYNMSYGRVPEYFLGDFFYNVSKRYVAGDNIPFPILAFSDSFAAWSFAQQENMHITAIENVSFELWMCLASGVEELKFIGLHEFGMDRVAMFWDDLMNYNGTFESMKHHCFAPGATVSCQELSFIRRLEVISQ